MRGDQLVGVMIAGSEEDPERPIGYAISAQEVYRSISTSMGGLPVRLPTALENAINAVNPRASGCQRDLTALLVRQLFDVAAPAGRIESVSGHPKLDALANIQTGNAALTALLKLGFFCSSIGMDFATFRRHRLTFTPFRSKAKRVGEMLYQEMTQLSEGQAVTHLIIALSARLPWSDTPASRASECARLLSVLMDELQISPLPAHTYLSALVESTCDRYTSPSLADYPPLGFQTGTYLARSLGRAMYAIRTDAFFVHKGRPARILEEFMNAYSHHPVVTVDGNFQAHVLSSALRKKALVPRIYIARPHEMSSIQERAPSYDTFYGNVVESEELNDLLENEKETNPVVPRGVYETNPRRFELWALTRRTRRSELRQV